MARQPLEWPTGVEPVGQKIRIRFTWNGKRRCETLQYPQTASGVQAAASLRAQVVQLAKMGVLNDDKYAELFPSSSYALKTVMPTFGQYAQVWLDGVQCTPETRRKYLGILNMYWMPLWAHTPLDQIRPLDCRQAVGGTEWASGMHQNRVVELAGAIFKSAVADELIATNPMRVIRRVDEPQREIDPFTAEERDRIIEHLYSVKDQREVYGALFEFAFFTGMRMTEILALRWEDIDFTAKTARVRSVMMSKEVHARTKTKKTRDVRLMERALHALKVAEKWGRLRSEFVFAPPPTNQHKAKNGKHFTNTELTRYVFKKALAKLGIRDRRQRDTRHTYATLALMSGVRPAFISQQLGNSVIILMKRYAKWVNTVDDWTEIEKMEAGHFGTKLVQGDDECQSKPSGSKS